VLSVVGGSSHEENEGARRRGGGRSGAEFMLVGVGVLGDACCGLFRRRTKRAGIQPGKAPRSLSVFYQAARLISANFGISGCYTWALSPHRRNFRWISILAFCLPEFGPDKSFLV
jgi:hypothetical protein